ncbi:MAG: hypothetical protein A3B66_06985 [Alphaproteobacteria bacterium RIFCSPHIGHO2_02_FULL_46_13]|nr:MAG: hypothetical protein A3B66_06985 [Alphaproteobacteria bacterium RIFCSPHIGHO2_02_FULL_46_13]
MLKNKIQPNLSRKIHPTRLLEIVGLSGILLTYPMIYANAAPNNYGDDTVQLNQFYDPSYDPIGLDVWAFTLNPSLTTSTKFTDNVYAVDNNAQSDRIWIARGELLLKSNFTRHKLNVRSFTELGRYSDFGSEDYDDHGISMDARIDVTDSDNIPLTFNFAKLHEDRENPDNQGNLNPLLYRLSEGSAGLVHTQQTIIYKIITTLRRMVYEDSEGTSGTIDQSVRDKDIFGVYTNVGIIPDAIIAPYIYGNFLKLDYPHLEASGISRNSTDIEAGLGTIVTISALTRLSFNAGQKNRNFDDNAFDDLKTFTYGSNISWEPLEYLSFLLEADKTIQEATFTGTSASINTTYRISANYQIRDNLYLQPAYSLLDRNYQGAAGGRLQTESSGLNIVYKMNPNIWMNASYQHTNQDKKEDASGLRAFQKDLYGLSLKLQF